MKKLNMFHVLAVCIGILSPITLINSYSVDRLIFVSVFFVFAIGVLINRIEK